jgi:hypothetical protein
VAARIRFVAGFEAASLPTRAAAFLMVVSAAIHLALVPHFRTEDPPSAWLSGLDALLLVALSYRAFVARRWRFAAIAALTATILTYLGYLFAERERPDELGVATKMIELMAVALLVIPPRSGVRRRFQRVRRLATTSGVVLLTMGTGLSIWAVALDAEDQAHKAAAARGDPFEAQAGVGMLMQPDDAGPPTEEEWVAADRLVAETRAGIAKYQDVNVALADGYRPGTGPDALIVHYDNKAHMKDGTTLDPARPEALVYANTEQGPLLLGAMYAIEKPLARAPDAGGGSITAWHAHTNACISPAGLVGLLSPFGTCPAGSINIATGPMLHVWTVDLPDGPFGLEPDEEDIDRLLSG